MVHLQVGKIFSAASSKRKLSAMLPSERRKLARAVKQVRPPAWKRALAWLLRRLGRKSADPPTSGGFQDPRLVEVSGVDAPLAGGPAEQGAQLAQGVLDLRVRQGRERGYVAAEHGHGLGAR